jgi:hypothetical protein
VEDPEIPTDDNVLRYLDLKLPLELFVKGEVKTDNNSDLSTLQL